MKNIITSLLILGSFSLVAQPKKPSTAVKSSQPMVPIAVDRSKAPKAGPAPKIQVGQYKKFELPNGLKVFVVENHKVPRVSAVLSINSTPYHEGDKAGMVDMAGQMLTKGTLSKNKEQIDAQVDFVGANISSSGNSVSAEFLTKYTDDMMSLFADVVMNPSFNNDEFIKLKKQTISSLKSNKSDANAVARNVARVLRNTKNHPYGNITTEESVGKITLEDLQRYYRQMYAPNNAYLVLVGDIDMNKAQQMCHNFFDNWQPVNSQMEQTAAPVAPTAAKVVVVNKPGAVQSVINISYPVSFNQKSSDYFAALVMNEMLGGGIFGSRLNQNLREGKAYTYGAGSRLGADPYIGAFTASASVRTEVTDSAVEQFIFEMNRMRTELAPDTLVRKIKNYMTGSFARSLENPSTVANFAYLTARYGLAPDFYQNYLKSLSAVTAQDIQNAALKYITPSNCYILVVGNQEAISKKLERFATDGKVMALDYYGEPVKAGGNIPAGLTVKKVVDAYIAATGGLDTYKKLKNIKTVYEGDIQGKTLTITSSKMAPNFTLTSQKMGALNLGTTKFNGKSASTQGMGGSKKYEGEELAEIALQSNFDFDWNFESYGVKAELKNTSIINGSNCISIALSKSNYKETRYYDLKSGLLVRTEEEQKGPNGEVAVRTTDYSDYQTVTGSISVPGKITQQVANFTIELKLKEATANGKMKDSDFE
jgi:zinc protease